MIVVMQLGTLRFSLVDIGLFITLSGLVNGGFIIRNDTTIIANAPLTAKLLIFVTGILLTAILLIRKIKGAILIGIIVTTLLSAGIGRRASRMAFRKAFDFFLILNTDS